MSKPPGRVAKAETSYSAGLHDFCVRRFGFLTIVMIQIGFGALLTMNDGTLPCFLSEIFPAWVRYGSFAFCFNEANALLGGTAPFVATWLIHATGSKLAPAWYMVGAAVIALVAMLASRETSREPLAD
jgi:MFS transporter, MHS family, proline/betaine transporter